MWKNRLQNFAVLVLALLAMYQVGVLWLVNIANITLWEPPPLTGTELYVTFGGQITAEMLQEEPLVQLANFLVPPEGDQSPGQPPDRSPDQPPDRSPLPPTPGAAVRYSLPYAGPFNQFSLGSVQSQIEGLFGNPAAIRQIVRPNVWIYTDIHTVVRYYDSHILDFRSYHPIDRSRPARFADDFAAAVRFIENDSQITNEFYFAAFGHEEGRNVFYFDFTIGHIPPEPLRHHIEVTVDHGIVVRYRKLALNFY